MRDRPVADFPVVAIGTGEPEPPSRPGACPDDGTCHHDCRTVCYRTRIAAPASQWLKDQGLDPSGSWPEGTDARPRDRRTARDEFCQHAKGDNSRTVPPCLRTLNDEGRCPVHGANIYAEEPSRA